MNSQDIITAHKASSHNRDILKHDTKCGCFYCLKVFSPSEIKEWCIESADGEEATAICPYCGVDSIISESSGFPLTQEFLLAMHNIWFENC